jgi:hypothetical protein
MMRKEKRARFCCILFENHRYMYILPPFFQSGLELGQLYEKRALLSGSYEVKTSEEDCSRQARLCVPTRTHLSPLLTPTPWTARLTS